MEAPSSCPRWAADQACLLTAAHSLLVCMPPRPPGCRPAAQAHRRRPALHAGARPSGAARGAAARAGRRPRDEAGGRGAAGTGPAVARRRQGAHAARRFFGSEWATMPMLACLTTPCPCCCCRCRATTTSSAPPSPHPCPASIFTGPCSSPRLFRFGSTTWQVRGDIVCIDGDGTGVGAADSWCGICSNVVQRWPDRAMTDACTHPPAPARLRHRPVGQHQPARRRPVCQVSTLWS